MNLVAKGEIPSVRTVLRPYISICRRYFPHYGNQQRHRSISHVFRQNPSGTGDLNSATTTLVKIDVFSSDTGGDDEAERREKSENIGGNGVSGAAENGGNCWRVVAVGNQKLVQWKTWGFEVKEIEFVRVEWLEGWEARWWTKNKHFWKLFFAHLIHFKLFLWWK